jgi:hypothetical protein
MALKSMCVCQLNSSVIKINMCVVRSEGRSRDDVPRTTQLVYSLQAGRMVAATLLFFFLFSHLVSHICCQFYKMVVVKIVLEFDFQFCVTLKIIS